MNNNSEGSYLRQEIEKSIAVLKKKSKRNKFKTTVINGVSILLGALITLTLGLDVPNEYLTSQKNLALVFGALLTIINSWSAIFNYRKLWIRQKMTLLRLYQIRNRLGYRLTNNNKDLDLFEEYLSVWDKDSEEWVSIVRSYSNRKIENNDRDS